MQITATKAGITVRMSEAEARDLVESLGDTTYDGPRFNFRSALVGAIKQKEAEKV